MENKFPSFPFVLERSAIFRNLNLFLNNLFSVWSETEILDSREILRIHETIGLLNLSLSLVASVLINLLMKYGADALLPQNQKACYIILLFFSKKCHSNPFLFFSWQRKRLIHASTKIMNSILINSWNLRWYIKNFLSKTIGHSFWLSCDE